MTENREGFYYSYPENDQGHIRFDENQQAQVIVSMSSEKNGKTSKFPDISEENPLPKVYSITYHR
jgi:hypothetical protein